MTFEDRIKYMSEYWSKKRPEDWVNLYLQYLENVHDIPSIATNEYIVRDGQLAQIKFATNNLDYNDWFIEIDFISIIISKQSDRSKPIELFRLKTLEITKLLFDNE